jgi:CRP/FNR family transcriptional regulator
VQHRVGASQQMAADRAAWIERFPGLDALGEDDRTFLAQRARLISLPANHTIFAPGQPAEQFLLVLDGTVRVQQVAANGREIVLYRVAGGESCIMTTASLLSQDSYSAEGVTETPVEAVAVPKEAFDDLMARSPAFRSFVFTNYADRIADLMQLVDEVAFQRIDKRLAHKLIEHANSAGLLSATHQDLAVELGSAREVVSRHLKELQRRGLIDLTRGQIALRDRAALEAIAEAD